MKYRAMRRLFEKTRGRLYSTLYRAAMGAVAAARLMLLVLAYPLGNIVWDKRSIQFAARKWQAVLKWALGWPQLAL
jgi:hypothetical protein